MLILQAFYISLRCSFEGCESDDDESEESENDGDTLRVGNESLEQDDELRMHMLGLRSCYCKYLVGVARQCKTHISLDQYLSHSVTI